MPGRERPGSGDQAKLDGNTVQLSGVYSYPVNPAHKVHLSSKPVALITDLLAVTAADATVLDPFMGGSVGEACLATGRGYIGCELSPEYFEISRARLEEALASRG